MISVAIIGGTGYTGKYIVEFCNNHPKINEINIYANNSAGKYLHNIFPEFVGKIDNLKILEAKNLSDNHDVYFLALPHGKAMEFVPALIANNKKVIDLGSDYRLDNHVTFSQTYQMQHTSAYLMNQKIYGLCEQTENYAPNLVANPGCYPTSVLLGILPFVKKFASQIISVDTAAYSGISGAGKTVNSSLMFAENYNSVKAYNVGTHRHEAEIKQELNKFGEEINYSITTHLLPVFSGIYSTTIINTKETFTQGHIDELYNKEYENKSFIRLRQSPPELKWVIGSNYCDINVKCVGNKIIITSAIDNLIKGAAGQAVQNLNKLFGWEEKLGIANFSEELSYAE